MFFPEASFLKVFAWINVGLVYSYLKVVFQIRTFEFCKIKVFFPFNMRYKKLAKLHCNVMDDVYFCSCLKCQQS